MPSIVVKISDNKIYVVLTYFLASIWLLVAIASANLLRNPFGNPRSKLETQITIELMASQIPYEDALT